jgi:tRNA threonylcarbamoyladenosine biosynthesis protein TsaE
MNLQLTVNNESELPAIAGQILEACKGQKVFLFYAEMGTGKTTLIKQMCKHLGSTDSFSSPTYSIVNEYHLTGSSAKIYHIDLYRLKDLEEALALGLEDYLYSGNYCFIEWPELGEPIMPENCVKITIEREFDIRKITIFIGL